MTLLEKQKLLAGLYTNPKIRKEYFEVNNPDKPDEKEVTIFAEGLVLKRLNAVKSWLPLSFAYHGKILYDQYLLYATVNPMQGMHVKHQRDVLAFYDFIKAQKIADTYLLEILSYEIFNLKATLYQSRFLMTTWNFKFYLAKPSTIQDKELLKGRTFRLIFRFSKGGKWIAVL